MGRRGPASSPAPRSSLGAVGAGRRRAGGGLAGGGGPVVSGESVDRVSELLRRLAGTDRDERETWRVMADSLAAAGNVGFDGLAERARRLTAASQRSNVDALVLASRTWRTSAGGRSMARTCRQSAVDAQPC